VRYAFCMTKQIALRIPEATLAAIDAAVADGRFPNRTAAVLAGIDALLSEDRERTIDEAYRRAYGAHPQEEWIGEAGLAAFGAFVAAEEREEQPL
jgi:Arc/MetJ-type ribon-helix-helix transcriptional regulator